MRKFIVTGCPRSATGYMAMLFRAMGIPCGHEDVFEPKTTLSRAIEWYTGPIPGESSWLAWAFLSSMPGPVHVIHIRRDPWLIVDSLAHRNDLLPKLATLDKERVLLRKTIRDYAPRVFGYEADVDRAAAMLVDWTAKVDAALECHGGEFATVNVESLDEQLTGELLEWLEIDRDPTEIRNALLSTPHNVNGGKRLRHSLKLQSELVDKIRETAPGFPDLPCTLMSADSPRGRDSLAPEMNPALLAEVDALAESWGYKTKGDESHAREQCAAL